MGCPLRSIHLGVDLSPRDEKEGKPGIEGVSIKSYLQLITLFFPFSCCGGCRPCFLYTLPRLFCHRPLRLLDFRSIRGSAGGGKKKPDRHFDTHLAACAGRGIGERNCARSCIFCACAHSTAEPPGSSKSMEAGRISAALIKGSLSMCLATCSPQDRNWRVERQRSLARSVGAAACTLTDGRVMADGCCLL